LISSFPSPTIPCAQRPWTPQSQLPNKIEFQEECKKWNVNDIVFTDGMWKMYEPLLRADFTCFDEYPEINPEENAFKIPSETRVSAFWASLDKRCTKDVVNEWYKVTSPNCFQLLEPPITGHHLFPYDEAARHLWFKRAISEIEIAQPAMLFECIAPKGAAIRSGCELTTRLMEPELQSGWLVKVTEEQRNAKGTDRLHIVSLSRDKGQIWEPNNAWASKKLFHFLQFDHDHNLSSVPSGAYEETKEEIQDWGPLPETGTRHIVIGKSGAMLRKGAGLSTQDLQLTLDLGTECYVVQTHENRSRLGRYIDPSSGKVIEIDAWCTSKFLHRLEFSAEKNKLPQFNSIPTLFPAPSGKGHIFLFPGQGAQKVGMMSPYIDTPGVKAMFQFASKVFGGHEDLLKIIQEGPESKLNDTRYSQVCVFLTSLAAVKKLAITDPEALANAHACAGFSLGEYTALTFAGVMDLETAVTLLKLRGVAMGEACQANETPTGMMTVVGMEDQALTNLMSKHAPNVTVANQLFPKGRVLAGPKTELSILEAEVKKLALPGSKTIVQPVSGAFHSKYMQPAATKLQAALANAQFRIPDNRLVYSNVTAKPHPSDVDAIKAYLVQQLTAGVLWEDTIRDMDAQFGNDNINKFFEPQPGRQLTSMMKRIFPANNPKMNNI